MTTAQVVLLGFVAIFGVSYLLYRRYRYKAHVPHNEFVSRWQKLPSVEKGTKGRFR